MPRHMAAGVNYQAGSITNEAANKGVAVVIFPRAFNAAPDITTSPHITDNAPKNGSIKWKNRFGFAYHFGGDSAQVISLDWSASEVV